jgi:hypothetical protein
LDGKPVLSEGTQSLRDLGCIELNGEITAADVDKLPALLNAYKRPRGWLDNPVIYLNSPGGDIVAAMKLGEMIRKGNAWTVVDANMECSSACVYILAAGVDRIVNPEARIGLHRPTFAKKYFAGLNSEDARKLYSNMVNVSQAYFSEMGISAKLFEDMLKVPSEKMQYVSRAYTISVNLKGVDPGHEEWKSARREKTLGKEKMKAWNDLTDCLNSGVAHEACTEKYGRKLID